MDVSDTGLETGSSSNCINRCCCSLFGLSAKLKGSRIKSSSVKCPAMLNSTVGLNSSPDVGVSCSAANWFNVTFGLSNLCWLASSPEINPRRLWETSSPCKSMANACHCWSSSLNWLSTLSLCCLRLIWCKLVNRGANAILLSSCHSRAVSCALSCAILSPAWLNSLLTSPALFKLSLSITRW